MRLKAGFELTNESSLLGTGNLYSVLAKPGERSPVDSFL